MSPPPPKIPPPFPPAILAHTKKHIWCKLSTTTNPQVKQALGGGGGPRIKHILKFFSIKGGGWCSSLARWIFDFLFGEEKKKKKNAAVLGLAMFTRRQGAVRIWIWRKKATGEENSRGGGGGLWEGTLALEREGGWGGGEVLWLNAERPSITSALVQPGKKNICCTVNPRHNDAAPTRSGAR